MWQRFKRAMRSFVGFFVSTIEDPELILEQNIRDLNDQVPKMNESIAMVRANVTLLEKENAKYKTEVGDLTAKVKAGDILVGVSGGTVKKNTATGAEAMIIGVAIESCANGATGTDKEFEAMPCYNNKSV